MAVFKDVHGGTGRGSICGTGRGQFVVQGVANLWYRVGWPICGTGWGANLLYREGANSWHGEGANVSGCLRTYQMDCSTF